MDFGHFNCFYGLASVLKPAAASASAFPDHLFPGDTIYITDNSILGGCSEHCRWASDGYCDDGGPGFQYADCVSGTDCTDCGPRPATWSTTEGHMMYTAPTRRGPGTVLTLSNFVAAPGAQAIALSGGGGDELIVYRIGLGRTLAPSSI